MTVRVWLLLLAVGKRLDFVVSHRDDGGDQVTLELMPSAALGRAHSHSHSPHDSQASAAGATAPAPAPDVAATTAAAGVATPAVKMGATASPASADPDASVSTAKKPHVSHKPELGKSSKGLVCPCLEASEIPLAHDTAGDVIMPASYYGLNSDQIFKRERTYGSYCGAHDKAMPPHCDPKTKPDEIQPYCNRRWCFVSAACACGAAAQEVNGKMQLKDAWHIPLAKLKHDYYNPQEGEETNVWYSYKNCGEGEAWIDDRMSKHDSFYCGNSSVHCTQEEEMCYRDAQGGRYAGAQAKAGSTVTPWVSIILGLGAFGLLVLLGWLLEGMRSNRRSSRSSPSGETGLSGNGDALVQPDDQGAAEQAEGSSASAAAVEDSETF